MKWDTLSRPIDVLNLLEASSPYSEYSEKLMLYGQFVGSWMMEATWYEKDGESQKGKGEWHFGWILGGRGIQDVLFAEGSPPHTYGTTIRCYDPSIDAWHVTWMQPSGGEYVHLLGQKIGDRIVNQGFSVDQKRLARWSFSNIFPDSFLWHGEVSFDNGATWFLEQEMRGIRMNVE